MASLLSKEIRVSVQPDIVEVIHDILIEGGGRDNQESYQWTENTNKDKTSFFISKEVLGNPGLTYKVTINNTFTFKGLNITEPVVFNITSLSIGNSIIN